METHGTTGLGCGGLVSLRTALRGRRVGIVAMSRCTVELSNLSPREIPSAPPRVPFISDPHVQQAP